MMVSRSNPARRATTQAASSRLLRPLVEGLEGRVLLDSAIGQWTYSSRITYSLMPDGTSIGGTPSVLFQRLDAIAPTATWENQIEQAATPWETNANLNLALVADDGAPSSVGGDQQDDPRFGDIRIGAMPLPSGVLAETFLPPPSNGGTLAGDIVFNSNVAFRIGGGYDLQTIAAHEFGHALGLGDQSTDINSVMYYSYNGSKTALDLTDVAGIQSLYGAPQYDRFNSGLIHNNTVFSATNITPYIGSTGQITLSGLDNTTAAQTENYVVTVPASNSGHMVVTLQSTQLSSFAPGLYVLNSSLQFVGQVTAPTTYGATVTVSVPVSAGQKYYIKVASAGTYGRVGAYGLQVNFGTQAMGAIAPPDTTVAEQPDAGSGVTMNVAGAGSGAPPSPGAQWTAIGDLADWAVALDAPQPVGGPIGIPIAPPTRPAQGANGTIAAPAPAAPSGSAALAGPSAPQGNAPAASAIPAVAAAPGLVPQAVDFSLSDWSTEPGLPSDTDTMNPLLEIC